MDDETLLKRVRKHLHENKDFQVGKDTLEANITWDLNIRQTY